MHQVPWLELLDKKSHVLIIHHWDSDGVSSAAIITQYLNANFPSLIIDYVIPDVGTYRILPNDKNAIGNISIPKSYYDMTVILDYSVPEDDIINYASKFAHPVVVYDHHLRTPIE